ncbi:MAG TPA: ZIP family metal transporter [Thermoanaerobaculia bacterium]|nr:ZIP family metal transporter [Thermoanaerobaculia bacterium]
MVWLEVFVAALVTALATGLGALPLLVVPRLSPRAMGVASGCAGGLMLAASHGLVVEGSDLGLGRTLLGVILGLVLIQLSDRLVRRRQDFAFTRLEGAGARRALLVLAVMTIHSFAEGIAIGVSYGGGAKLGLAISAALALHNIPEGLTISLTMVPRGVSVGRAAWWSVFSSLPQPLMAVPAYLFVLAFTPFLPVGLGLAAGAMIWMVVAEILPEALDQAPHGWVATAVVTSFAFLLALQGWLL